MSGKFTLGNAQSDKLQKLFKITDSREKLNTEFCTIGRTITAQ